jgi:SAM-dependent methyltransferase
MILKNILNIPSLYSVFRHFIGSDKTRQWYADNVIKAKYGSNILDIGCGPGDILNFLPEVSYLGFDLSPEYIESARRRFGDRGEFYCEQVGSGIKVPELSFDIVIAHGVLHHLNDDEAKALFSIAHRSLKPGGRLVTMDGCYIDGQSRLARYFLSQDRGQFVRTRPAYEALARSEFQNFRVTIRHDLIRLPYTHIIMECQKHEGR